jgi:HupE / UreJ protein
MKTIRLALLMSLIAFGAAAAPTTAVAAAHAPQQGYIFLKVYSDSTVVRLEFAVTDLVRALSLPWDPKARPKPEQIEASLATIRTYVEPRFAIGSGAERATPVYRGFDVRDTESGEFVLLEYVIGRPLGASVPITMTPFFEFNESTRRNLLVIQHNWRSGTFGNDMNVSMIFSPDQPTQTLDLSKSSLWRGFFALVRLGVWHIWIGFDHILFLMALILPSVLRREGGRWLPAESFSRAFIKIVTIVSCFTIAHTITLSLAALGVLDVPSRLVESVIALSIAIAALHNLWPSARVNEAAIAFVFGLFHGFGFASVLGALGLGTDHLVLSLLGFNLGVEIGQVAIIAVVFPVLFFTRRLRVYNLALRLGSVALMAIGLLWVLERSVGFNVPLIPMAKSILGMKSASTPT